MHHLARLITLATGLAAIAWNFGRPADIPFEKHTLDLGANETCAFADLNGDGKLDIVSGENWFEAPRWTRHAFRELNFANNYIDDFSDLPLDANGDGQIDIVSVAWFSRRMTLWENPGRGKGTWKSRVLADGSPIEFAFLVDLDNDGKANEILPQFGDAKAPLRWYSFAGGKVAEHKVSATSYGHGIGAGDVNGDGRNDILTPRGWFEAPANPRTDEWRWRPEYESDKHLGFLHVIDVNGDGRNDIVTTNAHDYGIFWLEQLPNSQWKRNIIDDSWAGGHALTVADLNGDGRKDLLTGKRYMPHNGRDPGEREPLGIYWYESRKLDGGRLEWVRHVIDYSSRAGGGMQIPVADLDNDGDPDFAVGGKSGAFYFENLTKRR